MRSATSLRDSIQALVEGGRLSSEDGAGLLRCAGEQAREPGHAGTGDSGALAIVGVGLRLPGASDLDELAELFLEGRSVIEPIPGERVELALSAAPGLAAHLPAECETDPRAYGSWLRDIERFDPRPFGLDEAESVFLGPAERLFLQVADHALISAGQLREQLRGSATGVFAAYTPYPMFEYLQMFPDMDERAFVNGIPATLPYQLAYRLDLRGPVIAVNTTCSSSLSALHVAKNALRAGDCDLAVVAGVSLRIFPFNDDTPDHIVLSKNLRCAPFSSAADGIIGGEGVVVIVVKRLADAIRDRDFIHAVVAGSAVGSDGASNGLQAPNPDAQADVIRAAMADAGTTGASVGYVEAHGTGTRLGDFVEADALTRVFRSAGVPVGGCRVGSAKANFGHLGDCAGLAGLLGALTCLRTGVIHPIAGLDEPSGFIAWDSVPLAVSGSAVPWPPSPDGSPRQAGVTSLGISGTNAHVVLREAPVPGGDGRPPRPEHGSAAQVTPVLLSARSRRAMLGYLQVLGKRLAAASPVPLEDITRTLTARRDHGPSRAAFVVRDYAELVAALELASRTRTFERIPPGFATHGIYLADQPSAREPAIASLSRYAGPPLAEGDRELLVAFLSGADMADALISRFSAGRALDLPAEPPVTQPIWPRDRTAESAVDDLFYDLAWRRAPRNTTGSPAQAGSWIVIGDPADEVLTAVGNQLTARGNQLIAVTAGHGFTRLDGLAYEIDPAAPDSWAALFADLAERGCADLTAVVYAAGLSAREVAGPSAAEIEQRLRISSHGVFCMAQAIARAGLPGPLRAAVISRAAERVGPADDCVPDATRLAGFGVVKVLTQEIPTIRHVVVDHDLSGAAGAVAADLIAEVDAAAVYPDEHVAFRGGQRYVKRVVRQSRKRAEPVPVRPGGTYVIAGGTGYLGPQVASFLAERGAGTVVLLSRTGLPSRDDWDDLATCDDPSTAARFRTLIALEGTGTAVVSLSCDVTDQDQVARTLRAVRASHGPVAGCFMLTKQLYQLWIRELSFPRFAAAIRNRVQGVANLVSELDQDGLDFFVIFSSISSLIGTTGASECCAVNQYLDAIGPELASRGIPASVMNWTLILDDISEFAGDSPIPPISFGQFQGSMCRFFDDGGGFSIIAHIDPHEAQRLRPVLKLRFDDSVWEEISAAAGTASVPAQPHPAAAAGDVEEAPLTEETVRERVRLAWQDALGPAPFTETVSFFTAGGTSLSALRLVQLLRRAVPAAGFEVADLYNNPTVAAQVSFLSRAVHATPGPPGPPGPRDAPPAGDADDLDDLLDAVSSGAVSAEAAILDWAGGDRGAR